MIFRVYSASIIYRILTKQEKTMRQQLFFFFFLLTRGLTHCQTHTHYKINLESSHSKMLAYEVTGCTLMMTLVTASNENSGVRVVP